MSAKDCIAAWQEETENFYRKQEAAQKLKMASLEAVGDRERPDTAQLLVQKKDAQQRLEEADRDLDQWKTAWRDDAEAFELLSSRLQSRQKTFQEYGKLDSLYRMVSGNVSGSRMDLETFVQRMYLDRILRAANRRFGEMSRGQFELRMINLEKAGGGKNRGLDLMVYSYVTGQEREVRTLSGGESFMAALSLALGMADQIQENTSSIHLDMMFVDEGFGSLDDASREQAVRVLQEMAQGTKLIGLISHVTELKAELEDQLVVTKDAQGSKVKWVIS